MQNPHRIVASLDAAAMDVRTLYQDLYCARGYVPNQIKEQQRDLLAERTSAGTMRAHHRSEPSPD